MNVKINYNGDTKGYSLEMEVSLDVENSAEAIGYFTAVLHSSALRLSKLMEAANPKYHARMSIGVLKAQKEQENTQNINWPFDTFIVEDEK